MLMLPIRCLKIISTCRCLICITKYLQRDNDKSVLRIIYLTLYNYIMAPVSYHTLFIIFIVNYYWRGQKSLITFSSYNTISGIILLCISQLCSFC